MRTVIVAGGLGFGAILLLLAARLWTAKQPVPPAVVPAREAISAWKFSITSPAFSHEAEIPAVFTCDGENLSPPLTISGVPEGAVEGTTSFDRPGYGGPCPPSGLHRYFFTLYALDQKLGVNNQTTREALDQAMQGYILAQPSFMAVTTAGSVWVLPAAPYLLTVMEYTKKSFPPKSYL